MTFKPVSKQCPMCRKHVAITTADQKTVVCTNCHTAWQISITIRYAVKLRRIICKGKAARLGSVWESTPGHNTDVVRDTHIVRQLKEEFGHG